MVYVASDGRICNQQPWTVKRFFGIFVAFFVFLKAFFNTLIDPADSGWFSGSSSGDATGSSRGGGSGSSWGGGGGGGRPGGGGGGGGPRIGRIGRMSDIRPPGGCAGGSCGM